MKNNLIVLLAAMVLSGLYFTGNLNAQIPVDFSGYQQKSDITVKKTGKDLLRIECRISDRNSFAVTLDLNNRNPLIRSLETGTQTGGRMSPVATGLQPRFDVIIGSRDPEKPWPYIFFDKVDLRPFQTYTGELTIESVKVVSNGQLRTDIVISRLTAGSFSGDLVLKFYSGSPFIHIEAALAPGTKGIAYLYDGLIGGSFPQIVYQDNVSDKLVAEVPSDGLAAKKVRFRTIMGALKTGTIAVFPPPHAFIYPLDFSNNYGFVQAGRDMGTDYIGIKSQPNGDNRYRPWIDAPYGKVQHMGFFILVSPADAGRTLDRVRSYTHGDTYKEIPGYITFANHFHAAVAMTDTTKDPSGPKLRDAFMALNVKSVELAEFHGDGNPRDTGLLRLKQLKKMFEVCEKYSVPGKFTLIPGEEPNAFFPGHTMYFFPKPVYLTLRKGLSQPYKQYIEGFGEVYHAGNEIDMYNIYRDNGGLVWTSHPRIKASEKTPDQFAHHPTFWDDNVFFGGDWKAMPLDLSQDRLGVRSLKLLDDMNQMGFRKGLIGEVDPFKIDPSHELYAHMNINYLKVKTLPPASDWSPIFNAIKNFEYFTSTGEVLIHSWSVSPSKTRVSAEIEWTFPMAFAEVTWAEGEDVKTKTFPLADTRELPGSARHFDWDIDLTRASWVRFEAWDIARNGAFTPTIWLKQPSRTLTPIIYSFSLIDGDSGTPIPGYDPIAEGSVIKLSKLPTRNLFLRANSNLMVTVKVHFGYNGDPKHSVKEEYPYSIPLITKTGRHEVTGIPVINYISGKKRTLNFIIND